MKFDIRLADGLVLPLDVVTQKLAWMGTTGSGKTYGAMKLAELMWRAGYQFEPFRAIYNGALCQGSVLMFTIATPKEPDTEAHP